MSLPTSIEPGYKGFAAFCELVDEPLQPFQKRIARAYFGTAREIAAILPRGNFKTTTAALLGLHHLLTVEGAIVTIGAASASQARICFERMRGFAQHPALEDEVTVRHLELRREEGDGILRVIPASGPRAHGLSSTLSIADEVWSWRDEAGLLEAMTTALVKRPDSKLIVISSAADRLDSPLGRLRSRALGQSDVRVKGVVTEAIGDLHWLEWSLPDELSADRMRDVKKVNPAKQITAADLRRQHGAVPEVAFLQFHCNRWGIGEGTWLPAGAWQACARADTEIEDGEDIWIAIDIASRESASCAAVTEDLRVEVATFDGNAAMLAVSEHVKALSGRYRAREILYDPWRWSPEALRLEAEGLPMVEHPQTSARMVPASETLYSAIVEGKLTHSDDEDLNAAIAATTAKSTDRGWRLERSENGPVLAIAVAVGRAATPVVEEPVRLLGWLS